jgi:hypothetical protein
MVAGDGQGFCFYEGLLLKCVIATRAVMSDYSG